MAVKEFKNIKDNRYYAAFTYGTHYKFCYLHVGGTVEMTVLHYTKTL